MRGIQMNVPFRPMARVRCPAVCDGKRCRTDCRRGSSRLVADVLRPFANEYYRPVVVNGKGPRVGRRKASLGGR